MRGSDVRAFERLFEAHFDPLCRFVFTYVQSWETAQDLVDDVFLQLWVRLQEAQPIRELKTYLFTTARNHAIDYLRRQRVETRHREQTLEPEALAAGPGRPAEVEARLHESELAAALQRAVDMLPPRQREVMLLKWERQATNEEIARILGIAPTTVSEHLRRALVELRSSLPPTFRDLT